MKVFILAAGKGTRLYPLTKKVPKALIELRNGLTPLDFQLKILKKFGFNKKEIFIIGGHKFETLKKYTDFQVVFNEKYEIYNNIYTFYMISNYIEPQESFIVMNSDTIFSPVIFENLIKTDLSAMAIDNLKILGDEEMKVKVRNGKIIEISKAIPPDIAHGEYIGISMYKGDAGVTIFREIEDYLQDGKGNKWYEDAINEVLDEIDVAPVYTQGEKWIEIDTMEDLNMARSIIDDIQID